MTIARRLTALNAPPDGWDLYRRAKALIAAGVPVTELTIGEHDIRTDPVILDAMDRAARAGATGYSAIPGTPALRAAVAERVSRTTGHPAGPENILITPGGQAALFMAHHAACDEGDRALFIDPFYATYPGTIRAVGAQPVAVPARPEHGFQPQRADLMAAAAGARSLLINSPSNPTGTVYSAETLGVIADVAQAHDLWLISDEVYDSQVWDGAHLSPRALPGMADRTLVVGSLSKSHAMTGSRLGWVAGPADVIAHLTGLATHTTYGIPGFVQAAGLFALGLGPAFEAQIAAPFARRREITRALVAGQNIVALSPPGGAMYALLDIRATGLTGEGFAQALLDAERIAVMPGESFGQAAAGHVRVAMTLADDVYEGALARLLDFAQTCWERNAA
jgi:arginine:pyruvate transaminase